MSEEHSNYTEAMIGDNIISARQKPKHENQERIVAKITIDNVRDNISEID